MNTRGGSDKEMALYIVACMLMAIVLVLASWATC